MEKEKRVTVQRRIRTATLIAPPSSEGSVMLPTATRYSASPNEMARETLRLNKTIALRCAEDHSSRDCLPRLFKVHTHIFRDLQIAGSIMHVMPAFAPPRVGSFPAVRLRTRPTCRAKASLY